MQIFNETEEQIIRRGLFTMRLIVVCLYMGELVFGAVVLYLRSTGKIDNHSDASDFFPYVAGGLCGLGAIALLVMRFVRDKAMAAEKSLQASMGKFFALGVLLPQSVCEGAAFFCLMTIFIGSDIKIMLPIFVGIFLLQLTLFPTRGRFEKIYHRIREQRLLKKGLD